MRLQLNLVSSIESGNETTCNSMLDTGLSCMGMRLQLNLVSSIESGNETTTQPSIKH